MAVCSGSDKICDVFTSSHTSNTGRVTGSVSGKTDYLVVGKSPGFSKVSKARKNPRTKLIGLRDLGFGLEAGVIENKNVPPLLIKNFSEGYKGNGLARIANQSQWHQASGTTPSKTKNANNDSSSSSHDRVVRISLREIRILKISRRRHRRNHQRIQQGRRRRRHPRRRKMRKSR